MKGRRGKYFEDDKVPCVCACHIDGTNVVCSCWMDCCSHVGEKYRGSNGSFDEERFKAVVERAKRHQAWVMETRGGVRRPGKCECGRRWNKRGLCPECDKEENHAK